MIIYIALAFALIPRSRPFDYQPVVSSGFGDTIPIRFTQKSRPLVQARVGDATVWLLLDTGATGSCFTPEAAKRLALKPTDLYSQSGTATGTKVETRYHDVPELTVGRCVWHRRLIEVVDFSGVADAARDLGLTIDGVLGADLLRQGNAVIDYRRQLLHLYPNWSDDLRMMQGRWKAVDMQSYRGPVGETTRGKLHRVKLSVSGDRMRLDMSPVGSVHLDQRLDLLVEHSPRRWGSRDVRINGNLVPGDDVGSIGLYEVSMGRLRLLLPSFKAIPPNELPKTLTAAVPDSGLTLFTFERVPPALGGWPDLLLAALTGRVVADQPFHVGEWEYTLTPDWALTGVNAARKLQFTARLDGSITFQPLKP